MRTDDLIGMLAAGAGPVAPPQDGRRLALGVPPAWALAVGAVALWLGLLTPDLWAASATAFKMSYAAVLAGAGIWLLRRLGRPGSSLTAPIGLSLAVLAGVGAAGLWDVAATEPAARAMRFVGKSATQCPAAIFLLALPALAVTLAAARALAPVRLRLAGAAAGLAAGGAAASAYALGCPEGAPMFIAFWYTLGIVLVTGFGALIGPRLLRW